MPSNNVMTCLMRTKKGGVMNTLQTVLRSVSTNLSKRSNNNPNYITFEFLFPEDWTHIVCFELNEGQMINKTTTSPIVKENTHMTAVLTTY